MKRSATLLVLALIASPASADDAPTELPLWPDGAPGAVGEEDVDRPGLRIYAGTNANGCGVVVCPGGGYGVLAYDHEGHQVAKWFQRIGVTAAVLKYRHAPRYRHPVPLGDVQRAIRHLRANAKPLGIDPERIGVMGFSAGGHLASTAATHFDAGNAEAADAVDRVSCRPDFAVLAYPVITMAESFTHRGSVRNLLGDDPDPKLLELLSNEKQVTKQTPPTFLFHTATDRAVPVENSLAFFAACRKHGVPAGLHVYERGPHGVGLAPGDRVLRTWPDRLRDWLRQSGFLAAGERASVKGTIRIDGEPLRWGQVTFVPHADNQPRITAMVSRGRFAVPAEQGPRVGVHGVEIVNLGSVEPRPTLPDAVPVDASAVTIEVAGGVNVFDIDLATE